MRTGKIAASFAALALLSGCISIGGGSEPPEQLLTLTAAQSAPAGTLADGNLADALAVQEPSVAQRLNVTRVPVMTGDSTLAYLQGAFWVQKPAQLFQTVLTETIRAQGGRLVVAGGELEYAAATQLMGELVAMDYHAGSGSVVVRYDAVLALPDGSLLTRRFEANVSGVAPEATAVGDALNRAANEVAAEVAEWVS